jgi:hypothetical protein
VNATHQSVLLYAVFSLFAFTLFLKKILKLKKHLDLDLAWVYSRVKMTSSPFLIISIGNFLHDGRIALYRNDAICPSDGRIDPVLYFRPTDE